MIRIVLQCALVFLASRGLLELVGVGSRLLAYPVMQPQFQPAGLSPSVWLDIWGAAGGTGGAFLPLYPWLAGTVSGLAGVPPFTAMLAVSNLAFFLALPLVRQETAYHYGDRAGDLAVVLICIMPGSFVFSSASGESLFLLFVMLALVLARREDWLPAGLAASGAVFAGAPGVLLVIPIAICALQSHGGWRDSNVVWRRRLEILAAIALPVLALAGLIFTSGQPAGSALAAFLPATEWVREFRNALAVIGAPLSGGAEIRAGQYPAIALMWISLAATALLIWRRNWPHGIYMAAAVAFTLASGALFSFRFFLTMAPLIMVIAALAARYPVTGIAGIALMALANGAMMAGWALGLAIR